MGIGVVLLFYLVFFGVLAVVCGVFLSAGVRFYLRALHRSTSRLSTFAAILPFLCVVYAGAWFIAYFAASNLIFHHDPGLGDGWYANIGNGYAIDMIDVTDQGVVHPTSGESNGLNDPAGIGGVRRLQVSPPYLFGTQDLHGFEHLGQESHEEDVFFVIDTRDHKLSTFTNESQLQTYALVNGKSLNLKSIESVYDQFRFGWFDYSAFALLLLLPLIALAALLYRAWQLRHEANGTESG